MTDNKRLNYWKEKHVVETLFHCPNINLFRLVGCFVDPIKNKKVLDVGFGLGADLIEFARRGATVYGLDINQASVDRMQKHFSHRIKMFRAGHDHIPFDGLYDVIYSVDLICYLDLFELKQFLHECAKKLNAGGILIVQVIEADLKSYTVSTGDKFSADFLFGYQRSNDITAVNPIRFISPECVLREAQDSGLLLTGSKKLIHSQGDNEKNLRVEKYLVFRARASVS